MLKTNKQTIALFSVVHENKAIGLGKEMYLIHSIKGLEDRFVPFHFIVIFYK